MTIDAATDAEWRRVLAEPAPLGPALPGTLHSRYGRCGTAGCRCHADPPALHGPWWSWTRKVNGKTVTARLTDEQARDYQPWIANARRLREPTTELERSPHGQSMPTREPAAVEVPPRPTNRRNVTQSDIGSRLDNQRATITRQPLLRRRFA